MKQTSGRHSTFLFRMQTHAGMDVWRSMERTGLSFASPKPNARYFVAWQAFYKLHKRFCILLLGLLPVLQNCGEDLTIRDYTIPKTVQKTGRPSAGLAWELPKHWTSKPAGPMRLASFAAPAPDGKGNADVSVSQLTGDGGGLFSNVNRWRSQLGLPPASPAEIRASLKRGQGQMGTFYWIRLNNPAQPHREIYAALFRTQGATIFAKMAGPPMALKANEAAFLAFCRSLKKTEVQK